MTRPSIFDVRRSIHMRKKNRAGGFTLIEVLVVVAIIAIMTGVIVLRIDFQNIATVVRDTAQRTRLLMILASDQAIYSRQQLGIRFHPNSYEFYILSADEKTGDSTWEIIEDERLKFKDIPVDIEFEVEISGLPIVLEELEEELASATKDDPIKPHVLFLSNGEMMPDFRVVMADEEGENEHALATGEVEPVVVEALE